MRREGVAIVVSVAVGLVGAPALAAVPPKWKNCTVVNERYPRGSEKSVLATTRPARVA